MSSRLPAVISTEPLTFVSDGLNLEAELSITDDATAAVVLAHPHPQHGGNMRSIIPGALFAGLPLAACTTLRFNFRGIGNSEGEFGGGEGERHDLTAAVTLLHEITEGLPLIIAGWSFGADTALCIIDPTVSGWFLVAPPLRESHIPYMAAATDSRPKRFCIPQNDQFCPPEEVDKRTNDWVNATTEIVGGADHFLVGRTQVVVEHAIAFIDTLRS